MDEAVYTEKVSRWAAHWPRLRVLPGRRSQRTVGVARIANAHQTACQNAR
jgi:hypothetical protein